MAKETQQQLIARQEYEKRIKDSCSQMATRDQQEEESAAK